MGGYFSDFCQSALNKEKENMLWREAGLVCLFLAWHGMCGIVLDLGVGHLEQHMAIVGPQPPVSLLSSKL